MTRKRYTSDVPAAPEPKKLTARERALELARKQVPDHRIRAVLTTERKGTSAENAALVSSMAVELDDERETGMALLQERAFDESQRSDDGKSWRALELMLQQHAWRPPARAAEQTVAAELRALLAGEAGMSGDEADEVVCAVLEAHPGLGVTDLVPLVVSEVERRLAA